MARNLKKLNAVPKVVRLEPLETRVLYSADAAPLLALFDPADDQKLNEQPAERALWKAIDDQSDTRYLAAANDSTNDLITEVVIIDSTQPDIVDLQTLLQSQLEQGHRIAIVTLDATSDPIESIAEILSRYNDLQAVHIISYAADGELQFGDQSIDQSSLLENSDTVKQWGDALQVDGDILLYGCNLSATAEGRLFAQTLSTLSDADVASSSDITGHALKNGDWDLEVVEGQIETQVIATTQVQSDWAGSLDISTGLIHHWNFDANGDDSAGTANATLINGLGFPGGLINQAGDFDGEAGSNRFAEVSSGEFTGFGTSDFTIAFWMKANAGDANDQLIGNMNASNSGFSVTLGGGGNVDFLAGDGVTTLFASSNDIVTDGDWRHIVAKRTAGQLEIQIFNRATGTTDSVTGAASSPSLSVGSFFPLRMGASSSTTGDYDGLLDDVRIYNRALTTVDIAELTSMGNVEQLVVSSPITVDFITTPVPKLVTSANLLATDPDNTDDELVYELAQPTSAVAIRLNNIALSVGDTFTQADINNNLVSIVANGSPPPAGEYVYFSVDDGLGTATNTFLYVNINTIASANTAPDVGNSVYNVLEDDANPPGIAIEIAVGPTFTDADAGDSLLGILVNAAPSIPAEGEWQYSTDGSSWYAMGVVSDTNALALSATTLIRFVPGANFDGTPGSLNFRALDSTYVGPLNPVNFTDGANRVQAPATANGGNTAISASIGSHAANILSQNDSPVLVNSILPSFDEDTYPTLGTVLDLFGPSFSDVDVGDSFAGIAIVANPTTTEGDWVFSVDGSTWQSISTVSAISALTLSPAHYIKFLPVANYNGTPPALEVLALDSSYSGSVSNGLSLFYIDTTSAFATDALSENSAQGTTTVLPVNDRPLVGDGILPAVLEDTLNPSGESLLNLLGSTFVDPDLGDTFAGVLIANDTSSSGEGDWEYSIDGLNWLPVGAVSSSQALVLDVNTLIRFLPSANYSGAPGPLEVYGLDSSWTGSYSDGVTRIEADASAVASDSALSSISGGLYTSVTSVNDAPVFDTVASTLNPVSEDAPVGTVVGTIVVSDVELDLVTLTLDSPGSDFFTINALNQLVLAAPVNFESNASINLSFTATDSQLGSTTWNTVIAVQDANDSPVISSASLAGVLEDTTNPGGATVASLFAATMVDEDTNASFTGVAITGNAISLDGEWQYSNDGVVWTSIGAVSANSALVIAQTDLLRFLPSAHFNGTPTPLDLHGLDNEYGSGFSSPGSPVYAYTLNAGEFGAISATTVQLQTAIGSVNDRPVVSDAILPVVVEDTLNPPGESVLALFEFGMADADIGDSISGVVIVGDASTSAQGRWEYSHDYINWLPVGAVSSAQGLVLDRYTDVRFLPAADFSGVPGSLSVHGLDLTWNGGLTGVSRVLTDTTVVGSDAALSTNTALLDTQVLPVNDAPIVDTVASIFGPVSEATAVGSVVGSIVVSDADNDPVSITLSVPASNYFTVNAANELIVTAPIDFESNSIFNLAFTISDAQSAPVIWNSTITILDVNEAPTISPASLAGVAEDTTNPSGATVASLFGSVFVDEDASASLSGIAITSNSVSSSGQWQYSSDGVNWADVGSVSGVNALVIAQSDLLRFLPNAEFSGTPPSLQLHALDDGYSGGFSSSATPVYLSTAGATQFGAISLSSVPLFTTINPVNDRPLINDATLSVVQEDALNPPGDTLLALFGSSFTDSDVSDAFTGVIIIGDASSASEGHWEYSVDGTNWSATGSVSTSLGLVLDRYTVVRFVPALDFAGFPGALSVYGLDSSWAGGYSDNITVALADSTSVAADAALSSNVAFLDTVVSPVNDAPSDLITLAPLVINENSANGSSVGTVLGVDIDSSVLTYSLQNDASGRFTIDANTGVIVVADGANLDFESNSSHIISVAVTDPSLLTISRNFSVAVQDVNEAPVFTSAVSLQAINEDDFNSNGELINSLFQPVFSDQDAGQALSGIAIVEHNTDAAIGYWEYQSNGNPWYNVGPVSNNNALVLGVNDSLRFVPASNYHGPSTTLSVHALDSSYAGGAVLFPQYTQNLLDGSVSAISTSPMTASVPVLPVNDAPFGITTNPPMRIDENSTTGDSLGIITAQDIEDTALTYTLGANSGGRFMIDAVTGEVRVASGASLDYETDTFHQIRVEVVDSGSLVSDERFIVYVNDVNEAPQLVSSSLVSIVEGTANPAGEVIATVLTNAFSDVDAGDSLLAIAITDNPSAVEGDWQYNVANSGWQSIGNVSLTNALIISASDQLRFVPAENFNGTAPPLSIYAIDSSFTGATSTTAVAIYSNNLTADVGSSLSETSASIGILILPVNDAPTVTLSNNVISLPENTPTATAIDVADITVSDIDGGVNNLSLSGPHAAMFQIAADKLQLQPGVLLDAETLARLDVTVSVDDASIGAGVEDDVTYSLSIDDINEPPELANIESFPINFLENSAPTPISSSVMVAEPDGGDLNSASVQFLSGYVPGDDQLSFVNQNGIVGMFNVATGELSLTGQASAVAYQSAIRSINYSNASDDPAISSRVIAISVTDEALNSNVVSRDINVVAINDAPTIVLNSVVSSIPENSVLTAPLAVADSVVTDVDGGASSLTLSGAHAALFQINANQLQLNPGVTLDAETLAQLDVVVSVDDINIGVGVDDSASYTLLIDNVNEPPVLSAIELSAIDYVENDSPITVSSTIVVDEPDDGIVHSASIQMTSGFVAAQDRLDFIDQNGIVGTYNSVTGELRLNGQASAVDYQSAIRSVAYNNLSDNPTADTRVVQISVGDLSLSSNSVTRDINVAAVNDAPSLQLNSIVTSIDENTVNATPYRVADIVVDDLDGGINSLSLSGTDAAFFEIVNGRLQLLPSVTLDAETLTRLDVTVHVDDASIGSDVEDSASYTLLINDINEAPLLGSIEPDAIVFVENGAPIPISSTIAITEPDNGMIVGAQIQFSTGYNSVEDSLEFTSQLGISGQFDQATGVLNLTGLASASDYQTAINAVSYNNRSEDPDATSRVVEISVNDGVHSSNTVSREVAVVPVADTPIVQLNNLVSLLPENTPTNSANDVADISISDSDGGPNVLSLSGAHANYFQITGDQLQLKPGVVLDSESLAQLDVTVNVDDASIGTSAQSAVNFTLVVADVNEAPAVTSLESDAINFVENNGPMPISSTIEVMEPDNGMIASAQVTIAAGFSDTEDRLFFATQNGIGGTYDNTIGVLSLTGLASASHYQEAIRSVEYANLSESPTTVPRDVHVSVNDGVNDSNTVVRTINLVAVNDEQQLLVNTGEAAQQNDVLVLSNAMLNTTDVDQQSSQLIYTPTGEWSSVQLMVSGAPATSFTQADIDLGLVALDFAGASAGLNLLSLVVDDGQGSTTAFNLSIDVVALPEPTPEPVLAAALPAAILTLPDTVLSVAPMVDMETLISFETLEQGSFSSSSMLPEDGANAAVGVFEMLGENNDVVSEESARRTDNAGAMGEASLSEFGLPKSVSARIRLDAETIEAALSEPSTIHRTIKLTDAQRTDVQMASLLSLDPLSVGEQTVFRNQDSNVGLIKSLEKMQEQLASASDDLEGTTVARDTVIGFSLSVTAGFLIWMLRGGALLASLVSISPLWKQLDPLPILSSSGADAATDTDKDKVESMFGDESRAT